MIKAVMERISMKLRGILLPLFQFASCVLGLLTDTSFSESINDLSREDSFWKSLHIWIYLNLSLVQYLIEYLKMRPVLVAYPHSFPERCEC